MGVILWTICNKLFSNCISTFNASKSWHWSLESHTVGPSPFVAQLHKLENDTLFFATTTSKLNKPGRQETSKSVRYPISSTHGRRLIWTHTVHSNTVWFTWPTSEACESQLISSSKGFIYYSLRCRKSKSWIWIGIGRSLILGRSTSLRLIFSLHFSHSYASL